MMLSLLPFLVERRMRLTPGRCPACWLSGPGLASAAGSSRREVMPSLVKTLRRCHSTVRADRNSWAPISGLVRPSRASRAMWASCGVSVVDASRRCAGAPSRRWRSAPGGRARRTPPSRSRRACRGRCAAARARRRAGPRGAATRRRAGGRGPAPDGAGCGPAGRSPRGTASSAAAPSLSSARERASMPSAEVGAAGLRRLRQPLQRVACELGVSGAHGGLDQLGQRPHGDQGIDGVSRRPAGPPPAPRS